MKLPKTMLINGEPWKITRKPLYRRALMGQCIHRKREIQICNTLTGDELEDTFLHEVLHACAKGVFNDDFEEAFIGRVTPTLLFALKGLGWVR
jgi:hypothetical protein